jgi:Flp pilus assembly pilin Flp
MMKSINKFFCDESSKFLCDESGLELAEYVVAAGLIVLAIVAAFTDLGNQIAATLNNLAALIRTS